MKIPYHMSILFRGGTNLEPLLRGSVRPLTVKWLGILVLTFACAEETNEISHPGAGGSGSRAFVLTIFHVRARLCSNQG